MTTANNQSPVTQDSLRESGLQFVLKVVEALPPGFTVVDEIPRDGHFADMASLFVLEVYSKLLQMLRCYRIRGSAGAQTTATKNPV